MAHMLPALYQFHGSLWLYLQEADGIGHITKVLALAVLSPSKSLHIL